MRAESKARDSNENTNANWLAICFTFQNLFSINTISVKLISPTPVPAEASSAAVAGESRPGWRTNELLAPVDWRAEPALPAACAIVVRPCGREVSQWKLRLVASSARTQNVKVPPCGRSGARVFVAVTRGIAARQPRSFDLRIAMPRGMSNF